MFVRPPASGGRHPRPSRARHLALAAATGVLLALSFPRPGWSILAHLALVPLILLALRATSARRLAWTTYLVSLAWWLVMIRWMYPVSVGGTVALSMEMACYWPLFALLVRFLHHHYRRAAMVLIVPAVWVSLEIIRCEWIQGGFAWFALGHSQMPTTPGQAARLVQVADLLGQYGVSFVVAMTNGLIVDIVARPWQRREPGDAPGFRHASPARARRTLPAAVLLWFLVIVGALVYGQVRLGYTGMPGQAAETLGVGVIQTNVPQSNKENPSDAQRDEDWQRLRELTAAAGQAQPRPSLIVWPETMVPAALNPEAVAYYRTAPTTARGDEVYQQQVRELASTLHVDVLAGAEAAFDWRDFSSRDGKVTYQVPVRRYNSAFLFRSDGSQDPQRYDKIHLVPFGEYLPWVEDEGWLKSLFMRYISPYDFDYTIQRGHELTVFLGPPASVTSVPPGGTAPTGPEAVPGVVPGASPRVRIATPICFEDVYPGLIREMAYGHSWHKRVDLLANLTNDGWFVFRYDAPWLARWYAWPVGWLVGWAGTSDQGTQEIQSAAFRCIENRVPMVRSVNRGVSGFIDSDGRIGPLVSVGGQTTGVEGFATHTVTLDRRITFFGVMGYLPLYLMQALMAVLILGGLVPRRKIRLHFWG